MNRLQQNINHGVFSLENLAAQTVGENADKIGMNTLQALPTPLQTEVAWFLPASVLLQLNDALTERGVNLDPVWTEHVNKMWPREMTVWGRKADPIKKFFKEESPMELYCRLFFGSFLGHQGQQEGTTHKCYGPCLDVLFTPLHGIQRDSVYHQESHPRILSQQRQAVLASLSQKLHHLTLGNRVLCKLMKEDRKVWGTLLSNVNSFRVFSISRTKGLHALQFLLQAMAGGSLKAFGLDIIQENDAVLMLLLLVCSGILQQGPRAMEVINGCLSEFSADQIGEAKPLLELVHDFLFPPLTVEPLSDVSDASDDDSDRDPSCPIDLYNEALLPLTTHNRELSFEMSQGKDKNQSEELLQDSADDISTGTSLRSNHCVCVPWLGRNYTHMPREGGFPETGLECFVLNRASGWSPKCLELSLPHWTSLRKLVLGSIAINCQDLRALLPVVVRGQLTHLLLDNVEGCHSLPARLLRALAEAQGCRGLGVPVLQHLTLKAGSKMVCSRECEDFTQEVTLTSMHGVEELELSLDFPDEAVEDLVCAYLQADLSIARLTLSPHRRLCFGGRVPHRALASLAGKASLTSVELNAVKLDDAAVQGLLVRLFRECQSLQSLAFLACFGTGEQLFSGGFKEVFISEILSHPSLKTLTLGSSSCVKPTLSVLEAVLTEEAVLEKLVVCDLPTEDIISVIAGIEREQKCHRQTKLKCLELEQTIWTGLDRRALGEALEPFVEKFQCTEAYHYSCSLQDFEAMM